jgi:diguanylate cyclase (GGDEF)-like protein
MRNRQTVGVQAVAGEEERIVAGLRQLQGIALVLVGVVAATVLSGWMFPALRPFLPGGWNLMKASSALLVLLTLPAFAALRSELAWADAVRRGLGWLVAGTAALVLLSDGGGFSSVLERALNLGTHDPDGMRMSFQTALFLCLLGLWLSAESPRQSLPSGVLDALLFGQWFVVLLVFAGYVFDAASLFMVDTTSWTSPPCLAAMALLAFSAGVHRVPQGAFAPLVRASPGAAVLRRRLPFALVIPLAVNLVGARLVASNRLSPAEALALGTVLVAAYIFVRMILLAGRINILEEGLRKQSYFDELTDLYNRRAFYELGHSAHARIARSRGSLAIVYFDIDGLKAVNDEWGHTTGSELLREFAGILRETFRSSDVIARLGGDEFAVVTDGGEAGARSGLERLGEAAVAANRGRSDRPYRISYSAGMAAMSPGGAESFEALVNLADKSMYTAKRESKGAGTTLVLVKSGT